MWIKSDIFTFWKAYSSHKKVSTLTWKDRLISQRKIDPKLFELNKQWYYNWHIPITGLISFVIPTICYLYNYKYIIFSNEKSADIENTKRKWINIIHQYSKSVEFEKDFNNYMHKYINPNLSYFSLLNWFYEITIAKMFSQYPQYFWEFVSCNNNFKITKNDQKTQSKRCLNCPKCLSTFSLLRPRISKQQTLEIFWNDIFEQEDKINSFKELLWIKWHKPFECVGTTEEIVLSIYYTYKQYKENNETLPIILKLFEKEVMPTLNKNTISQLEKKLLKQYNEWTIPKPINQYINNETINN
jgi:hypothetical protein